MATLYDIRERAELLSAKLETGSITPEEVGGLIIDLTDYAQSMERDGSTLGIRKVYPTLEAMQADLSPVGDNGKPLRRGNLVAIYEEATATTDPNSGLVSMWTGERWASVARIGTAMRHEYTSIESRITDAEEDIKTEIKPSLGELRKALEELTNDIKKALDRIEYTQSEKDKLAKIKTDGKGHSYLGADGQYHNLPIRAVELNGERLSPSDEGKVAINTLRSLTLNGKKRSQDEAGNISMALSLKAEKGKRGYKLSLHDEEQTELSSVDIEGGGGSGGGFLNITRLVPLSSGYYTLPTALLALKSQQIAESERRGLIISIETSAGVWQDYRYIGTSTDDISLGSQNLWETYAPIQSVEVDGVRVPAVGGKISLRTSSVEVADSVDESDRPVASRAVRAELDQLANLKLDSDTEQTEEGTRVTLSKDGQQVTEFVVAGGGGGNGSGSSTKAVVQAQLAKARVKLGDSPMLTWGWAHYTDGTQDGISARVDIIIRRGVQEIERLRLGEQVSGAVSTLALKPYITTAGVYSIVVEAIYDEGEGPRTKRNQVTLSVLDLAISLHNKTEIASYLTKGGYADGEVGNARIVVRGGARELRMIIDGEDTTAEVKTLSSSATSQTFLLPINTLSEGIHSLQFVASVDDVRSNSIYLDIVKQGSGDAFVCLLYERKDGKTIGRGESPLLLAEQYGQSAWEYIVVSPTAKPITALSLESPSGTKTFVPRPQWQVYSDRYLSQGRQSYAYSLEGAVRRPFAVEVVESGISGVGIKEGAVLELLTHGRSNEEAQPAQWRSTGEERNIVSFEGVDFASSGWVTTTRGNSQESVLRLINGAKAVIDYKPFATDVKGSGLTIELELKMSGVRKYSGEVFSCFDSEGHRQGGFGGFRITPSTISMLSGGSVSFKTEDGGTESRPLGVEMQIAPDDYYHIALVVHPQSEERSLRLYVNGVLSKADIYGTAVLQQATAQPLVLDSTHANVEFCSLRVYDNALSDDEVLTNYITSRPTLEEMLELRERNDVLDLLTGTISYDKLVERGRGVLSIVMADGGLERLWGLSTDTKTDHPFEELLFRSPLGRAYDLKVTEGVIRRQGTSTSTYPVKNLRIYLKRAKTTKVYRRAEGGKSEAWEEVEDKSYRMRPDSKPMHIINLKTDYADSSLTHNTGLAWVYNDICRTVQGMATPGMQADPEARAAIDGMPIDVFTSSTVGGDKTYCGQFQFNNDKSKSGALFGQTKKDGTEIALEGINNMTPIANFQLTEDPATQLARKDDKGFDASWEFLYPEADYMWHGKTPETTAPDNIKQSVIRLMQFIRSCTPSVDYSRMSEAEVKQAFKSDKFKREASQYFNIRHLCMWYVFTDYNMSVDQRAKNLFLRTWNGLVWYITYYDGDTSWTIRNDAMSVYLYNINRDTWDAQRSKYAFEGHNSVLWNLVLANFEAELAECATLMRKLVTNSYLKRIFEGSIQANWSERQYNKSGIYKYLKPASVGFNGDVMNYSFALNGNLYSTHQQILTRRWSLLDAKYRVEGYEHDNIPCYVGKGQGVATTAIKVTAGDEYFFGWKTQNGNIRVYEQVSTGATIDLPFEGAISQNDPVRIIGASRIKRLDLATTAPYMQGAMNLGKCKMLEEFVAPVEVGVSPTQWFAQLGSISGLKHIDLTGQSAMSGTEGASSTLFDVSTHTGLQTLKLSRTAVRSIRLAEGAPITLLECPTTLTSLRLRALPKLTDAGIVGLDWSKITSLELAGCPQLDWRSLLSRCTNIERLRIEGVDIEDDGTLLSRLMRVGGLTLDGRATSECALTGRYQLTQYIDDELFAQYQRHFPELSIRQPEYTMVELDDNTPLSSCLSNLDNRTGYKFGNTYQASAHIAKILSERFACLGKQVRSGTGSEMLIYRLHEDNWLKLRDHEVQALCSDAVLDGSQGDIFIYEPEYWYKGVNDILNKKKYYLFASGEAPKRPQVEVITHNQIEALGRRSRGFACKVGLALNSALAQNTEMSAMQVSVKGYRRVRCQYITSPYQEGVAFFDKVGNYLSGRVVTTAEGLGSDGDYIILDVPERAETLCFTVNNAFFDTEGFVVLSKGDKLEDMEPEWVHHKPRLVGALHNSSRSGKLGSFYAGGASEEPTLGLSAEQLRSILSARGLRLLSYETHKDIINLAFVKYGTKNFSQIVGYTADRNGWAHYQGILLRSGMQDTSRVGDVEGYYRIEGNANIRENSDNITKAMGYERLTGGPYPMYLDGAVSGSYWRDVDKSAIRSEEITDDEGERRQLGFARCHIDNCVMRIVHGKRMDIFPSIPAYLGKVETRDFGTYYGSAAQSWNHRTGAILIHQDSRHYDKGVVALNTGGANVNETKSKCMYIGKIRELKSLLDFQAINNFI